MSDSGASLGLPKCVDVEGFQSLVVTVHLSFWADYGHQNVTSCALEKSAYRFLNEEVDTFHRFGESQYFVFGGSLIHMNTDSFELNILWTLVSVCLGFDYHWPFRPESKPVMGLLRCCYGHLETR